MKALTYSFAIRDILPHLSAARSLLGPDRAKLAKLHLLYTRTRLDLAVRGQQQIYRFG